MILSLAGQRQVEAQSLVIRGDGKAPGDYYLKITIGADGSMMATPVPSYTLGDPTTDPTDPPTNPDGQIFKEVKALTMTALADGGSLETAKGFSAAYGLIGNQFSEEGKDEDGNAILVWVNKGEVNALKAQKTITNLILNRADDATKWGVWTAGVQTIINRQRGVGKLMPQDFIDIGDGTKDGAETIAGATVDANDNPVGMLRGRGIFRNIDIEKLLRIILAILAAFG